MTDVDDYWEPDHDREPSEPDSDAIDYAEHCETVHAGTACNCPPRTPEEIEADWAEQARRHNAEDHGGGECDCQAPF